MISHDQFQTGGNPTGSINMSHSGTVNTTFELREAVLERTKKRLDRYRQTADTKKNDHEAQIEAKLLLDMQETQKYLAKVNESKIRKHKTKDSKKDIQGVGGLSKDQTDAVQSKIRERAELIQSELKINRSEKSKKKPDTNKRIKSSGVGPFASGTQNEFASLPISDQISSEISNFPPLPPSDDFNFAHLSDRDIQNVLGDVKSEAPDSAATNVYSAAINATSTGPSTAIGTLPVTTAPTGTSVPHASGFYQTTMYTPAAQASLAYQQHYQQMQQMYNNPYGAGPTSSQASVSADGGVASGNQPDSQWHQQQQQQQGQFQPYQSNGASQLHDFLSNHYS